MTDLKEPHEAAPDEDPELHIGQEVPDPWDDQGAPPDWPLWFGKSGGGR